MIANNVTLYDAQGYYSHNHHPGKQWGFLEFHKDGRIIGEMTDQNKGGPTTRKLVLGYNDVTNQRIGFIKIAPPSSRSFLVACGYHLIPNKKRRYEGGWIMPLWQHIDQISNEIADKNAPFDAWSVELSDVLTRQVAKRDLFPDYFWKATDYATSQGQTGGIVLTPAKIE